MIDNSRCPGCFMAETGGALCKACGPRLHEYEDALDVGTTLNSRYLIGSVLGRGGFAITYLAWDLNGDCDCGDNRVAIKEYLTVDLAYRVPGDMRVRSKSTTRRSSYSKGMDDFLREATMMESIREHEHIVRVYNRFEENKTAYIVLEYAGGWTFESYLQYKDGGRIQYKDAHNILDPVMDALAYAHARDIYHLDIAPDNIMITPAGIIKLIDFGAAKYLFKYNNPHTKSITVRDGYSPIELYGHDGHGPWTDVYGLGASFYSALTARVPPLSADRIAHDQLVPPSREGASLHPEVEGILMKALAIRREDRFQTVRGFQDALRAANGLQSLYVVQAQRKIRPDEPEQVTESQGTDTKNGLGGYELPKRRWPVWLMLTVPLLLLGLGACLWGAALTYPDPVNCGSLVLLAALFGLWLQWLVARHRDLENG